MGLASWFLEPPREELICVLKSFMTGKVLRMVEKMLPVMPELHGEV